MSFKVEIASIHQHPDEKNDERGVFLKGTRLILAKGFFSLNAAKEWITWYNIRFKKGDEESLEYDKK